MLGRIYLIRNCKNGKVYVGQTIEPLAVRWRKHKSHARRGALSRIAKAIRKYGEVAFDIETVAQAEQGAQLNSAEQLWVARFNSNDGRRGYNVTAGGDARCVTPEGIEKMRRSMIGKRHTTATKILIANASHARWSDSEFRQHTASRISQSLTGRRLSDSHKQHIGVAQIGRKDSAETRERKSIAARKAWATRKDI